MSLTSILPYYGSKRALAPQIIGELRPLAGSETMYDDPFMGSLAVVMAKRPGPMEMCNDLFGHAINLARVLASDRWEDLCERVSRTLIHEELFAEAKARQTTEDLPEELVAPSVDRVEDPHVDAAYWTLVYAWQGINGVFGTGRGNVTVAKRYTPGGGHGGTRWGNVGRSMPEWHERLMRVFFTREDALYHAERIADEPGVVMYLDPPYLKKSDAYVHDMTIERHKELALVLMAKQKARVVLSYYDDPMLRDWYDGWTFVELDATKGLVNQGARGTAGVVKAPEILIINGPSFTQQRGLWCGEGVA